MLWISCVAQGAAAQGATELTTEQIYAKAASFLSGSTLRCVDFTILAYCGTYNEYQISPDDCSDQFDQFGEFSQSSTKALLDNELAISRLPAQPLRRASSSTLHSVPYCTRTGCSRRPSTLPPPGDGFSRLKLDPVTNRPTERANYIMRNLSIGSAVTVDLSELEGVNTWLLKNFSEAANISVTVDILRLPDRFWNESDRTKQLDYVFNIMANGGRARGHHRIRAQTAPASVSGNRQRAR